MRRFKLLNLALTAAFVLSAAMSSVVFAENPEILPVPTVKAPLKFTLSGGLSEFVIMANPKILTSCEKTTGKGEFTSADLGKVTIDISGCGGFICGTLGDKHSVLLLDNADIHLVDILVGGVLTPGVAITPPTELHFECSGGILFLSKGTIIGQVEKANGAILASGEKVKELDVLFRLTGTRLPTTTECDLLKVYCFETVKGVEVHKHFELLTNFGEEFQFTGWELSNLITFEKEAAIDF